MRKKCKPNCRYQMLEQATMKNTTSKYICDLYETDLECDYPGDHIVLYRCYECIKELEQLEIIEDTKNV